MILRRRRAAPSAPVHRDLDAVTIEVVVDDGSSLAAPLSAQSAARARAALRVIVAEALILQDRAEVVLAGMRDEGRLGDLAPPTGVLVSRFVALRADLPEAGGDPRLEPLVEEVRAVLDHHAFLLHYALDLLAYAWSSERLADQLRRLRGLGAAAGQLDAIWAELQDA